MQAKDSSLEWAIIGGGIHGTYLANMLLTHGYASHSDIRIIDPGTRLLQNWRKVTSSVDMQFLRSPGVHHIGADPLSLKDFAQKIAAQEKLFMSPNDRPSLKLFNAHSDDVILKNRLAELHWQGFALNIETGSGLSRIHTGSETLKARNVILATGQTDSPFWPEWAQKARIEGANIQHVLDPLFSKTAIPVSGEIVVVGGGISAVQTALSLSGGGRNIKLLSPHPMRYNNYDADPGWMGPKYLSGYSRIRSSRKRRSVIRAARNTGTITHELRHELALSQKQKECTLFVDQTESCSVMADNLMLLRLLSGEKTGANCIVLATGYKKERPGGFLIDQLIDRYSLQISACGYPETGSDLQWQDGLFVTGALAELEVGPASRNIIGARMAANRILKSLSKQSAA